MVIGEHGDSEMIPWSTVRIGGKDIYSVVQDNQSRLGQEPYQQMKKIQFRLVGKFSIVKGILVMV